MPNWSSIAVPISLNFHPGYSIFLASEVWGAWGLRTLWLGMDSEWRRSCAFWSSSWSFPTLFRSWWMWPLKQVLPLRQILLLQWAAIFCVVAFCSWIKATGSTSGIGEYFLDVIFLLHRLRSSWINLASIEIISLAIKDHLFLLHQQQFFLQIADLIHVLPLAGEVLVFVILRLFPSLFVIGTQLVFDFVTHFVSQLV